MAEATYSQLRVPDAFMPCARPENKQTAMRLLTYICPDNYIVEEVHPFPATRKPFCRWIARFTRNQEDEHGFPIPFPLPGPDLRKIYRDLTKHSPAANSRPLAKHHWGDRAFVVYAVTCPCNRALDFDLTTYSYPPGKWPAVKHEVVTELTFNEIETLGLGIAELLKTEDDRCAYS